MKPFAPFGGKRGKRGESRGYYEVPVEIIESQSDLMDATRAPRRTPTLLTEKRVVELR